MDKLAQNSQEDIAFGVGETVGEFVAGEGVGAAATKILGYAGKIIGRTRIGSATSKVFTEASSKVSAVRQGVRSFESKAFSGIREGAGKFAQGFRENAFKGTYANMGGLSNLVDGLEGGIKNVTKRGNSRIGTGVTEGGMSRVTSGWRERFGPASMREHHLVPQALLNDSRFTSRLNQLGVSDAKVFIDKKISHIPNAEHMKIHADGWNSSWKSWLDDNPNFSLPDVEVHIKTLMNEYNVPKSSRNFTRSYGKN